jgi:hypothetical protein
MNVGTLLALGFPDTGDYYRRGYMPEFTVANFFILHYLLVQILKRTLYLSLNPVILSLTFANVYQALLPLY